jgi:hypothetical protein
MLLRSMGLDTTNSRPSTAEQTAKKDKIEQAIKKLWSADDLLRLRGREELLQIGAAAAGPLSDLLMGLVQDRHPRFATEMEQKSRRALEAFLDRIRVMERPMENDPQLLTLSRLAINSRLINDVISLLGELKAPDGVPILIQIMERRQLGVPRNDPELRALAKIGSPAVPFLVNSISTAEVTAVRVIRQRPISFGYILSPDSDDLIDYDDDEEEANSHALDSEEEWEVGRRTRMIKEAALKLLMEIGDKSVLPFLKTLAAAEASKTPSIAPYVQAAIEEISNERVIRPHPRPPLKQD